MRHAQAGEREHHVRMVQSQLPDARGTPVVPDEVRLRHVLVIEQSDQIQSDRARAVCRDVGRA